MIEFSKEVREKVLKEIEPSEKEHKAYKNAVEKILQNLRKKTKLLNYAVEFEVGGSFGKGTYLKNSSDIDIFCIFETGDSKEISFKLEQIVKNCNFNYKSQRGSRTYFEAEVPIGNKKFCFEFIPIKKVQKESPCENSQDMSTHHKEFVESYIKKDEDLASEIRLTKQLFKSKKWYGAESYIKGFSGHVIDILICHYKSLINLLEDMKLWREMKYIDVKGFYSTKKEALENLSQDKHSYLCVIDPVDRYRNSAKALCCDIFHKSIFFAQNCSKLEYSDFQISEVKIEERIEKARKFSKENNVSLLAYEFSFELLQSRDIIGSKILKVHNKISSFFSSLSFREFRKEFYISFHERKALSIHFFEKVELPTKIKVTGPKIFMRDAVLEFVKLRGASRCFVEGSRAYSFEKRKVQKLKDVENLNLKEFSKMLGKDFSFVSSVKLYK